MSSLRSDSPLKDARQRAYRSVILDAAEGVFADHGFESTRVQHIADKAGVSVGTIYSVFGSKSELFSTVLTRRLPDLLDVARRAAIGAPNTLKRLLSGVQAYLVYLLEHPSYLRLHLREHPWGLGPTRATSEQLSAWREGLELQATVLKQAIEEGIVIREDPYRLARCITAVHQVQLWDWVEHGMSEPPTEVAARLSEVFVQMFCTNRGER
jgi:AcrR family transcriptional regulator